MEVRIVSHIYCDAATGTKSIPRGPVLVVLTAGGGGGGRVVGQSVLGVFRETASSKVAAHFNNK